MDRKGVPRLPACRAWIDCADDSPPARRLPYRRADCVRAFARPTAAAQEARPDPLPGTRLSVEQLKAQMFHVSAGKRLKGAWPNGAKVAVGLSFDVDNATATLSTGNLDYEILSRGEYGSPSTACRGSSASSIASRFQRHSSSRQRVPCCIRW